MAGCLAFRCVHDLCNTSVCPEHRNCARIGNYEERIRETKKSLNFLIKYDDRDPKGTGKFFDRKECLIMNSKRKDEEQTNRKGNTVLVAVDFSPCSVVALRRAKSIMGQKPGRILVLHVIDHDFVERCIHNRLGTEEHIKKTLYLRARDKLQNLLRAEGMDGEGIEELICEGTPFIEINKRAVEIDADMVVMGNRGNSGDMNMVVMGNRGNSGDMKTIFFGSTAERVLRFMKRPVLCVPLEEDQD
jgi:nucleotide-binding universal stress UspA family protein